MLPKPPDDIPSLTHVRGPTVAREMLQAAAPEMFELLLALARDTSLAPADRVLAATAALDRSHPRPPDE